MQASKICSVASAESGPAGWSCNLGLLKLIPRNPNTVSPDASYPSSNGRHEPRTGIRVLRRMRAAPGAWNALAVGSLGGASYLECFPEPQTLKPLGELRCLHRSSEPQRSCQADDGTTILEALPAES